MNSARPPLRRTKSLDREVARLAEDPRERLPQRGLQEREDRLDLLLAALEVAGRSGQGLAGLEEVEHLLGRAFKRRPQLRVGQRRVGPGVRRHQLHHPGEDVSGGGGEEHVLGGRFEIVAEDRRGDLKRLLRALPRVVGQVTEDVPHDAAAFGGASGGYDGVAGPVEVPEEVALRVEEDEEVIPGVLVPELPNQVLHRVGLAGADPAQEQDVRLDELVEGEPVRRRRLPAQLHPLENGDRAVLGAGRPRVCAGRAHWAAAAPTAPTGTAMFQSG